MMDNMKSGSIVIGYIRDCWKLSIFDKMRFPSDDVLMIVKSYFCMEYVHLFDRYHGNQCAPQIMKRRLSK